ncbi:interferon-induced protein 44-like [Mercenaria mercenaria]|uniref:interferon-induced protein 44-like n=1 Tax=Mercenaria mercenaria TaxID=6596 RepID=UPI00234F5477|nr:interferon-induced protein 44-like [Mercenaria mercenaria]
MYQLKYKHKSENKLHRSSVFIGDLPGFQEHWGIKLEDVKHAVRGHVPNNYKIKYGINRDSKEFTKRPEKKDKVNCVCLVFDISTPADELPGKIQETFKSFQRWLLDKKIPYIVILTKCDLLNTDVEECKYRVFENNTLKVNKDKLIQMFGFKQSKMFPVVNYIHEDTVVPECDALLIAALREILKLGKDCFEDLDDNVSDDSDNEENGSEDRETNKANS